MRFSLSPELLDRLDLIAAVESTVESPAEFFPSRAVESVAANRTANVAEYLAGVYRHGFEVEPAEVLFARKSGRGHRPVAYIPFRERVLLQSLVGQVSTRLPPWSRDSEAYKAFQIGPTEVVTDDGYVVIADVASFYEYVDHQLLLDHLVDQTGEAEIAESLAVILGGLADRAFGIPQGYPFSDSLSEVFIDPVERRLIRKGWPTWRYADDFRLAAQNWGKAQDAIEALTSELLVVGLHLNEEKLYSIGGEKYSEWAAAFDVKLQAVADEVEIDLEHWSPYIPADYEGDDDPEAVAAAGFRALELWSAAVDGEAEERTGLNMWVYRNLAATGLGYLQSSMSPEGLGLVRKLYQREPQMTRAIARYLATLVAGTPAAVFGVLEEIIEGDRLSDWQSLWLYEVVIDGPEPPGWTQAWLRTGLTPTVPDAVRARACVALASMDAISPDEIAEVFETAGSAARPDIALASTLLDGAGANVRDAIAAENQLLKWVVEDGSTQLMPDQGIEEAPF